MTGEFADPYSAEGSNKPSTENSSLKDILKSAGEKGGQKRGEVLGSLNIRIEQAKERASQALNSSKEFSKKIKESAVKFVDITIGLATNPDVRIRLTVYLEQKTKEGQDKVDSKFNDLREQANQNKDKAVNKFQDGMRNLWGSMNENLVKPQVNKANEIAKNVKDGGESVKKFFKDQSENARNKIRSGIGEVTNSWYNALSYTTEKAASGMEVVGQKVDALGRRAHESSVENRKRAVELRMKGANVRTMAAASVNS